MIIEPTGWGFKCDWCLRVLPSPEGFRDTAMRHARAMGWILVPGWESCSLDCLLKSRQSACVRQLHANFATAHMADHATACCRLHRTHATRGRHSWDGQCVDPNKAGVAVL